MKPPPVLSDFQAHAVHIAEDKDVQGGWEVVRNYAHWRVYSPDRKAYHRGSNGAVRAYDSAEAANNRANKLNGESK
jgi:hypothetical protein